LQSDLGLNTPPGFAVMREADFQVGGPGIREVLRMTWASLGPKALYQFGLTDDFRVTRAGQVNESFSAHVAGHEAAFASSGMHEF
jgi:hypothetical protein